MSDPKTVVESLLHFVDGVAIGVAFTTLIGLLPPLAALFTIVWISYQIYHAERKRKKEEREEK